MHLQVVDDHINVNIGGTNHSGDIVWFEWIHIQVKTKVSSDAVHNHILHANEELWSWTHTHFPSVYCR
jgi:hypothetical protein